MKTLTKSDIIKIEKTKLNYKKVQQFFHCEHCLTKYLKARKAHGGISLLSPQEEMNYEFSSYPFKMPDKTIESILVVWCKTCNRSVWDSRHLTHRY